MEAERESLHQQRADINRREEKAIEDYGTLVQSLIKAGKTVPNGMRAQIYQKYEAERKPAGSRIDSIDTELNNLDTSKVKSAKNEAKARLDDLIHNNQIYGLAAEVYGYDDATEHTGGVR